MLFEKVIDHNLIYDHNLFVCQELINSGMLLINLPILKLFIDDRNSFIIKERKNLNLNLDTSLNLDESSDDELQFILQHNAKIHTNSLIMKTGNIPEKL